ncbi:uncharacterized protein [Temnothorax longispinosus]|uniref:uncharacterized protein isoform X2 n=1 Tax=Temnothorax longispinosus TaxID=300112 RepID=UPI003A9943B2
MIRKEDQYFSVNRILLLTIGLWPYQQSNFTRFQHIFISAIFTTFITFQLTAFLTLRCTSELFMKVLSYLCHFTSPVIKYNVFYFNIEGVKDLLIQLQHIHNKLKNKNEIAIMKKYDCTAKHYAVALTILGVCGMFALVIVQFSLNMADVDLSTNDSRSYQFLFTMEYFIDPEKYFYFILLHINAAMCIAVIVEIAVGSMMIAYIHHICGMFRIASYRIENAININILQTITLKNKILMIESIICAVDIHRQAMKLNRHFVSTLEIMLFCLIICCVITLSLNLFQIASFVGNMEKVLMPFLCSLVAILHMFLSNLMGQIVIDYNNHIFTTAYNVQWYKTPLHIQRMILFLLQRETKEFKINFGRLFDGSMMSFATLLKASLSYFTVIHSTRS